MPDHFNELLLQTLKEVSIRLERLEGRTDHIINEKADKIEVSEVKTELKNLRVELKADINDVKTELKTDISALRVEFKSDVNSVKSELNELRDELMSQGRRIDSIETGIKTLQWTMTAGLAVLGIIIAFIKAF